MAGIETEKLKIVAKTKYTTKETCEYCMILYSILTRRNLFPARYLKSCASENLKDEFKVSVEEGCLIQIKKKKDFLYKLSVFIYRRALVNVLQKELYCCLVPFKKLQLTL